MPPVRPHPTPSDQSRPAVSRLGTWARAWWMRHGLLSREMAAARWPECRTLAAAEQVLRRVVGTTRDEVLSDLATQIPTLTPEFVHAAVRLGVDVVVPLLRRPDCTPAMAQTMLIHLDAPAILAGTAARHVGWSVGRVRRVGRAIGARGWTLEALHPPTWQAILAVIRGGRHPWFEVGDAWAVVLAMPDVSPDLLDVLLQNGALPQIHGDSDAVLRDPRLSATQRHRLWGRLLRTKMYDGDPRFLEKFNWALPGAIEALVDHDDVLPNGRFPHQVRGAVYHVLQVLHRGTAADRAHWWSALARAEAPAARRLWRSLWRVAPGAILRWDDAVSALLLSAGPDERVAVLAALGTRPTTSPVASPTDERDARPPSAPARSATVTGSPRP